MVIYFQLLHRQIYLHWAKTALVDFQLMHPLTAHCGFLEVLLHGKAGVEFPLFERRKERKERKRCPDQYVGKFSQAFPSEYLMLLQHWLAREGLETEHKSEPDLPPVFRLRPLHVQGAWEGRAVMLGTLHLKERGVVTTGPRPVPSQALC